MFTCTAKYVLQISYCCEIWSAHPKDSFSLTVHKICDARIVFYSDHFLNRRYERGKSEYVCVLIEKIANHHQQKKYIKCILSNERRFWIIQFKAYSKKFSSSFSFSPSSSLIVHIHFLMNAPIIIKLSHCVLHYESDCNFCMEPDCWLKCNLIGALNIITYLFPPLHMVVYS